jgi:hypothetical protein
MNIVIGVPSFDGYVTWSVTIDLPSIGSLTRAHSVNFCVLTDAL